MIGCKMKHVLKRIIENKTSKCHIWEYSFLNIMNEYEGTLQGNIFNT